VARRAVSSLICTSLACLSSALLLGASTAAETLPAVARPTLELPDTSQTGGTFFFLESRATPGAAAIGTAHTFDLDDLVRGRRVVFQTGHSDQRVAVSSRLLVPPGRPFNTTGATLVDDYVIFALESAPTGVRVLAPEPDPTRVGDLVQILGIPNDVSDDENDIYGRVAEVTADRIEVDLDSPHNLRGWGGAPVLSTKTKRVVGILQAYWPQEAEPRVSVAPIRAVADGVRNPLEKGQGRAFSRFGVSKPSTPAPSPTPAPKASTRALPPAGATKGGAKTAEKQSVGDFPAFTSDEIKVHLDIDYPPQGAVVDRTACGVFAAGRAVALEGNLRNFEVVLVIDTSRSTIDPSGADINGNGSIGTARLGGLGSIFGSGSTDQGDSILAAEVAAARQLLRGLDPRSTRVALVTFAGNPDSQKGMFSGPNSPAVTLEPLTSHYAQIERGLDSILAREPAGATHMAAGVDRAMIELTGLRGALSRPNRDAEKIVLFFTDGQPTMPFGPGYEADNVKAVLRAASRAKRASIRIHSFAIGPDALDGPIATVEMATRTDGYFTPVRHPGDLVDVIEQVSFANVKEISVRNATNGEMAAPFRRTADGAWAALIPVEPGPNHVDVAATTSDGKKAQKAFDFRVVDDATDPELPPELVVQKNRLLEDCLRALKEVRVAAERDEAERVRKELLVEIEVERRKARDRAEEQRKRLQLDVEDD
jgi:hypothetical protein